ncbi:hypothetical protein V500_07456 [Pseudogymnoascus sp. VKM F-4518 (FW-2643)]|nr:hypothetical protein V500_07456 [Pseudogymnoascus sp. VKM F-4518 (FW-2643)]
MPPPSTIPDSDADTSPSSPSTSPEPRAPAPSRTTILLGTSRKRSVSPEPTSVERESVSKPVFGAADGVVEEPASDAAKPDEEATAAPEPLSEEAKAEEKRVKQIEAIKARNKDLAAEVSSMEAKLEDARGKLKNPDAAATVKAHIKRLHAYNEIRDVGQGLIGLIAEQRGVRIGECYESGEFGVGARD